MTLKELHDALAHLLATFPDAADAEVNFGKNVEPVRGGRLGRRRDGTQTLNLAPLALDQVGGF